MFLLYSEKLLSILKKSDIKNESFKNYKIISIKNSIYYPFVLVVKQNIKLKRDKKQLKMI